VGGLRRWGGLGTDTTAALVAVVALLVYPLAWFQYDTALVPVLGWLAARIAATGNRVALWGMLVYLVARSVPDMVTTSGGQGLVEWLARNTNGLQVTARTVLLGAVIAARGAGVSWRCGSS